jgi:Serine carboxypeptidase S28
VRSMGAQGVNLWRLEKSFSRKQSKQALPGLLVQGNENAEISYLPHFAAQWFLQPLDHFDSSIRETFRQRYWANSRHYHPGKGGPVIVLDGGETSGEDRLPFLDTGIVDILAKATGGIGVVLEHRYYVGDHELSVHSILLMYTSGAIHSRLKLLYGCSQVLARCQ